ncbi:MAG TPA: hypothetical protein VGN26_23315 [Armatimonadota bacterium]|jgi:hypothetical protein
MSVAKGTVVRCCFCDYEFDEEEGVKACGACTLFGGCRKVKCPKCGYEMPEMPKLLKRILSWRRS